MSKKATEGKEEEEVEALELYPVEPTAFLFMPRLLRITLGWITLVIFSLLFLVVPLSLVFLLPIMWSTLPLRIYSSSCLIILCLSLAWPTREWPLFRCVGQLWYEIFRFSSNLSPQKCEASRQASDSGKKFITAMHPHGIVPFQAILWAAYCNQSLANCYGFGAAADVIFSLPLLRQVMGWLSAGGCSYETLRVGLVEGKSPCVNRAGRTPQHLFLLPGGIAEVFTSAPGRHAIVFKDRKGLIKLSCETGASILPVYVFGGTDFYHNLATGDSFISEWSRKLKMGMTLFFGVCGMPVPFAPRVTLCVADPLEVPKFVLDEQGKVPKAAIDELHARYLRSIQELFDKYKAKAGYPDARLEIL